MTQGDTEESSLTNLKKVGTVATVLTDDDFVMIGGQKVPAKDVLAAYGGTLSVGWNLPPSRKFGNPTPMGLCGFATSTLVLSLINCGARGVSIPNIMVSLGFFYGGLSQIAAGAWELVLENTFAATALSMYGMFWMSFAALLTPAFGIADAFQTYAKENGMTAAEGTALFDKALGFYLICWSIFTFMVCIVLVKSTVAMFTMFFLVANTFLVLAISNFTGNVGCARAGGVMGVIAAFLAYYNALAGLATYETSYFTLKPIYMPGGGPPKVKRSR